MVNFHEFYDLKQEEEGSEEILLKNEHVVKMTLNNKYLKVHDLEQENIKGPMSETDGDKKLNSNISQLHPALKRAQDSRFTNNN